MTGPEYLVRSAILRESDTFLEILACVLAYK